MYSWSVWAGLSLNYSIKVDLIFIALLPQACFEAPFAARGIRIRNV